MSKRPIAFRVPRLLGDMVSHYFVTTSEDEARAMADTDQVEYEGLYLVGDRHTCYDAQAGKETKLVYIKRWRTLVELPLKYADEIKAALAAQPPAAPVETKEQCEYSCTGLCNDGSGEGCNCGPAAYQRSSADTEDRKTFTIPPGHEAVRDSEGRATGEVRLIPNEPQAASVSKPEFETGQTLTFLDAKGEQHTVVYDVSEDREGLGSGWFLLDDAKPTGKLRIEVDRMWRSPDTRARFERETGQFDATTEAYHSVFRRWATSTLSRPHGGSAE